MERGGRAWLAGLAAGLGLLVACGDGAPATPAADAGVADAGPGDAGVPDTDTDGDGIPDAIERPGGADVDTDGDGTPDHLDRDSDGDGILDRDEGALDLDLDDLPSFRDPDSDGDGVADAIEAGDDDLDTPPVACAAEVDTRWRLDRDGLPPRLLGDGLPDFADVDRDNDGLGDGEELLELGTNPCAWDGDGDDLGDLVEAAYARMNCDEDPSTCDCPNDAGCGVPDTDFFVVLPHRAEPVVRTLAFRTALEAVDVALLLDTSRDADGVIAALRTAIDDLAGDVAALAGDPWIGAASYEDLPFAPYGQRFCGDAPLRLLAQTAPWDDLGALRAALRGATSRCGGDAPDGHALALARTLSGEGARWETAGDVYELPALGENCAAGRGGAPCFRAGAVPIVVHAIGSCAHGGPAGADAGCAAYTGVSPAPDDWAAAVRLLTEAGARYVGVDVASATCDAASAADQTGCHFLRETARAVGSVELDGGPLIVDLAPSSGALEVRQALARGIERALTRVPYDVDTTRRDDPTDAEGVDARGFVVERRPACRWDRLAGPPPDAPCWTAAPGFTLTETLSLVDDSTFFDVLPRAEVTFDVTFANDFVAPTRTSRVFVAFLDLRADGGAVVDTRQVFVLVPAGEPVDPG